NDVEGCAVGEIGARVSVARKRRSIRPNCRFKIVLSVLDSSRQGITIQTIARPDYRLWIQRPGHTDPRSPVILDGWRRKEFSSCYHYVPQMRIGFKCIRDTWCVLCNAAERRHFRGADRPLLIGKIERVPKSAICCFRLRQIIVTKT